MVATRCVELERHDKLSKTEAEPDILILRSMHQSPSMVLSGSVRVVLSPSLDDRTLGRDVTRRRSLWGAFSQLWSNPTMPEVRDPRKYETDSDVGTRQTEEETRIFLQDVPRVLDEHKTVVIHEGEFFGEIAALGRTPRTASIFAEEAAELLEIRWQGLREIRRRDEAFRDHIDKLYRERSLRVHFREMTMFGHLEEKALDRVVNETVFESYGEFDWYASFKRLARASKKEKLANEPIIVEEGNYADGLFKIRSGFARVSRRINNGHRTVSFLGRGDIFGFDEVVQNWRGDEHIGLQNSLRALGYVDILRVPSKILEEVVLPTMPEDRLPPPIEPHHANQGDWQEALSSTDIDTGTLEFLVENQYINGTATMLIDLDRCVRCDDCINACAAAHEGNPRFVRHGKRHDRVMVANACMHCTDPVCMIGCPTGAIHRSSLQGQVVINDITCIGCATCASSCPYDNIRMAEIRDSEGNFILDENTNAPIVKATKCDLCVDQLGGPACQRACPHDALRRVDMRDLDSIAPWLNR